MLVTFHVQPINEYDPEFTGNLDITITEVSSSCSSFFVPAIFSNTLLYGTQWMHWSNQSEKLNCEQIYAVYLSRTYLTTNVTHSAIELITYVHATKTLNGHNTY